MCLFNEFHATGLFLYLTKTSENLQGVVEKGQSHEIKEQGPVFDSYCSSRSPAQGYRNRFSVFDENFLLLVIHALLIKINKNKTTCFIN